MAITLDTAAQNNIAANGIQTAYSGATVSIQTAGDSELVSITLPSYNAPSSGQIAMASQPDGTASADGTAAKYVVTLTGGGTETGTVGTDMTLDNTSIVTGGTVTLTSFSVTQPGS